MANYTTETSSRYASSYSRSSSAADEGNISMADPMAAARWTAHLEGGPRRVNHAATAIDELVYSFGGYCTGDNYKDRRVPIDVFVLNVATLRWHAVPR